LGSLYRRGHDVGPIEKLIREEVRKDGEPLDRIIDFDTTRLFYVALSRAQNLLVLMRNKGTHVLPEFKELLEEEDVPEVTKIKWDKLAKARPAGRDIVGKSYSYTSDYILYKRCPLQYMLFKKYGFVPARSQMMLFGSLVHNTIEDLHNYLLNSKKDGR